MSVTHGTTNHPDNKRMVPKGLLTTPSSAERRFGDHPRLTPSELTTVQRRIPFFEVVGMSVGIASTEIVKGRSTIAVENRKHVTSAAMGISRPSEGRCMSCWNDFIECPGHLGYMDTPCYVHPLVVTAVAQLMTIVCHRCHRPLVSTDLVRMAVAADLLPESIFTSTLRSLQQNTAPSTGSTRLRHIVEFVRRSTACPECNAPVFVAEVRNGHDIALLVDGAHIPLPPQYIRYVLGCVLTDEVYWLCGLDPINFPPFHFVCDTLTVSPPNTRPSDLEHNRSDNITKAYRSISQLRAKVEKYGDPFYNELLARIHGIMLKPSRVSVRSTVDTSAVPRLSEVDGDAGVYNKAKPPVAQPGPRPQGHFKNNHNRTSAGGNGPDVTSFHMRLSGKRGMVRNETQTGRRDLCARQVMTCYNFKSVTEMIISPSISHNLKRLETVNPLNIARLTELQLRGRVTNYCTTPHEENFLPCTSRLMYEPRVGDVLVDTRGGTRFLSPGSYIHPVKQQGVLPIPAMKPHYVVLRNGKTIDPCVPAAVQPLTFGMRIERPMEAGDVGMRLRNPCIYESSILAQRLIVPDPKSLLDTDPTTETEHTSRRNTSEALAQRGDFDGDDNTIIANRGMMADAEVMRLMTPQAVFLSSKDGSACMYPTQDSALGLWALTMHTTACAPLILERHVVDDLLFESGINVQRRGDQLQAAWDEYAGLHPYEPHVVVTECVMDTLRSRSHPFMHTSVGLFSAFLPADLCYTGAGIRIFKGVLVEGPAHADVWSRHLMPFVHRVCGADAAVALLDRVERLGALVAERIGLSVSCFSNECMLRDAHMAISQRIAEVRSTASRRCRTVQECETRNYVLHHKLLGVQNAAQKITEKHIVAPLNSLPGDELTARWIKRALLAVGAPAHVALAPSCDAPYDYEFVKSRVVGDGLIAGIHHPTVARSVLAALYQPRWIATRASTAPPECFAMGPRPDLALHSHDAEMSVHSFMSDVDPTSAYCVGSRSVSIGTVSQMMCAVGQLFSDNGDIHNKQGVTRAGFVDDAPDDHVRAPIINRTANYLDWERLSDSVGTESSGMILRSFTRGLTSRSMHIMGTTVRSTMANSGNGTRRAGHLARLTSIYGENFSVQWDGAIRDNGRVLCSRFGVTGMWSSRKVATEYGDMPMEPRGLADYVNARCARLSFGS